MVKIGTGNNTFTVPFTFVSLHSFILPLQNKSPFELNVTACRVILDVMPGLQKEILESTDGLIKRCFAWARESPEPLQSYATGLLGAAMETQSVATDVENRERNQTLVPLIINRLKEFRKQNEEEKKVAENSFKRPFSMFAATSGGSGPSSPRKSPSRRISIGDSDETGLRKSCSHREIVDN